MEFNCEFVDRYKHDVETDHDCHHSKLPSEKTGTRIDETTFDITTLTLDSDPDTIVLEAQLALFKFLIAKAQNLAQVELSSNPNSATAQDDIDKLFFLSQLIEKIELDDYRCMEEGQQDLNTALDDLLVAHRSGPDVKERIDAVLALEKATTSSSDRV